MQQPTSTGHAITGVASHTTADIPSMSVEAISVRIAGICPLAFINICKINEDTLVNDYTL